MTLKKRKEIDSHELVEEPLVTISVYYSPHEAALAKCELNAVDIPVFVADEYTIGMNSLYSNALGGVKVMVAASRAEEARCILNLEAIPVEEEGPLSDTAEGSPQKDTAKWLFVVAVGIGIAILLCQILSE